MRPFEWLPSLIAAISAFVIGGLWYSPVLFAKTWQREAGISDERFQLFLATGLREVGSPIREATEEIELLFMPLAEAAELALTGQVQDGPSALALILAHHHVLQRGGSVG